MILTCPSCSTRYQADAAKFPAAGRQVRCAKCGTTWHQDPPAAEPDPDAVVADVSSSPPPPADAPAAAEAPPSDLRQPSPVRAYAPAASVQPAPPGQLGQQLAVIAGWIGLVAVVLLIGWSAVRYRQDIAVLWPQSAGVYSSLGMHVNAGGIDFRGVDYKRQVEDGQTVLAVSGSIVNAASRELPVPQSVRVTLSDGDNREVYHWSFRPAAATLKPGQSVPFLTRLSSPPSTARHLEVRFDGAPPAP
jgi:predicted Zn finger-like uncharacterized protein